MISICSIFFTEKMKITEFLNSEILKTSEAPTNPILKFE